MQFIKLNRDPYLCSSVSICGSSTLVPWLTRFAAQVFRGYSRLHRQTMSPACRLHTIAARQVETSRLSLAKLSRTLAVKTTNGHEFTRIAGREARAPLSIRRSPIGDSTAFTMPTAFSFVIIRVHSWFN
jgi:hypothetical protein